MRKKLIVGIDGGLVNKLLAYLSAKVICNYLDRDLYIYWTPHLNGLCEDLLILFDDELVNKITYEQYKEHLNSEEYVYSKEDFTQIDESAFFNADHVVIKIYYLLVKPKFISDQIFLNQMKLLWKNLQIKKSILDKVPNIPADTITVHIRRHHGNINISMKKYEDILEKELNADPRAKFFITTDNIEDKTHIIKKYPNECIANTVLSYWDARDDQGVIEAFIDVLCVNQTKKIYTPSGSTFTYLSRYEDEPVKTVMIENDNFK